MGDLQSFQEENPHPRIPPRRGSRRADQCSFPCSCCFYLGAQTLLRRRRRRRQSHIRRRPQHASSAANEPGVRRHSDDLISVIAAPTDGAELHPAAGEDLRRLVVSGQAAGHSSEHAGGGVGSAHPHPQIPLYLSSSRFRFYQIFQVATPRPFICLWDLFIFIISCLILN